MLGTTCTSIDNCTVLPFFVSDDWVKVFLARNASFDASGLTHQDFDRLFHQSVQQFSAVIGTKNPDLSKMKRAGTKILHGMGCKTSSFPQNGTVDYYNRVLDLDAHAADYYRLFLAPSVTHCGFGNGFDPADLETVFGTLKAWVENGTVPDRWKLLQLQWHLRIPRPYARGICVPIQRSSHTSVETLMTPRLSLV